MTLTQVYFLRAFLREAARVPVALASAEAALVAGEPECAEAWLEEALAVLKRLREVPVRGVL